MTALRYLLLALFLVTIGCAAEDPDIEVEVTETNVDPAPDHVPLQCDAHRYTFSGERTCTGPASQYAVVVCSDQPLCDEILAELQAQVEACQSEGIRFMWSPSVDC